MRKLRLELEDLTVESFETVSASAGRRGTVHGARYVVPIETNVCDTFNGCPNTTPYCPESDACPDTGLQQCGYSYGGTCGASPPVSFDLDCGGAPLANVYPVDDSPYLCV